MARNRYGSGGATLLSVVLPAAPIPVPVPVPVPTRPRSPGLSVNSIKVVVALSSDDTQAPPLGPAIVHELGLVSGWYASQTGGRRPRFVGAGGVGGLVPEVTTVVLRKTAAELEAAPDILVATLAALSEVFPRTPGDRVFVYSDVKGSACGHTTDTADTVIIWMMTCSLIPSENTPGFPYGATYVAAHEMTHMFGAVPACAPHSDGTRHVNDDPTDMLYAGGSAVTKAVLDPGHDDYYGHGRTDCPDIATGPLWQ